MASRQDIQAAILQRDIDALISLFFVSNRPELRSTVKTETELWDFKSDCPMLGREHENGWAHLAKDVLAFHNQSGGAIFFGIDDGYSFRGATTRLDSKTFNDKLRRYIGDKIWVDYYRHFIQDDQTYLGIAVVPARGPVIERFRQDAPDVNGRHLFRLNESAIRKGDSSHILNKSEADQLSARTAAPAIRQVYAIDQPMYRILYPDYKHFVEREIPCRAVERSL